MKMYMYSEEELTEIIVHILDVQDAIMAQDLDPELWDILEEALNVLEPEE